MDCVNSNSMERILLLPFDNILLFWFEIPNSGNPSNYNCFQNFRIAQVQTHQLGSERHNRCTRTKQMDGGLQFHNCNVVKYAFTTCVKQLGCAFRYFPSRLQRSVHICSCWYNSMFGFPRQNVTRFCECAFQCRCVVIMLSDHSLSTCSFFVNGYEIRLKLCNAVHWCVCPVLLEYCVDAVCCFADALCSTVPFDSYLCYITCKFVPLHCKILHWNLICLWKIHSATWAS